MIENIVAMVQSIGAGILWHALILLGLGTVFGVLTHFWACNPGRPWWRKHGLVTDLCYAFIIPLINKYVTLAFVVLGVVVLFGITDGDEMVAFYVNGHGPLAQLPLWLQAAVLLVGADVWMYWVHRGFHRPAVWRYHAVHHSSTDLDWISASRFHPVNIAFGAVMADALLLLAGVSPNAFVLVSPFNVAHSAFVHAHLTSSV